MNEAQQKAIIVEQPAKLMSIREHVINKTIRPSLYALLRFAAKSCELANQLLGPAPKVPQIPPLKSTIVLLSVAELADKVRKRELSSCQVVSAYIDEIKSVNGLLNAIVDERFDDALKEAQQVDDFLKTTTLSERELAEQRPLLGLPFTAKDSVSIAGMVWSSGCLNRKSIKATGDANVVAALRAAGAIPLAVTNVPELLLWMATTNIAYGATNNPFDLSRIPGGSSGGEASLLACCATPISISTDMAGSVRMPAFHCGLFGHKPTQLVIDNHGIWPPIHKEMGELFTCGTMARRASELKPIIKLLAGDNARHFTNFEAPVDMHKLRVFYMDDVGMSVASNAAPYIKDAIRSAAKHLGSKFDVSVEQVSLESFDNMSVFFTQLFVNMEDIPSMVTGFKYRINPYVEVVKLAFGLSTYSPAILAVALGQRLFAPIVREDNVPMIQENARKALVETRAEFTKLLGDDGVLIYVNCPHTSTNHYISFLGVGNIACPAILNFLNAPATAVPVGVHDGLPYGITVTAAPLNDRLPLAVAEELETLFGGWINPREIRSNDEACSANQNSS